MEMISIIARLAELAKNECIEFNTEDWDDRPPLTIYGERFKVETIAILSPSILRMRVINEQEESRMFSICVKRDMDRFDRDELMWVLHEMFYELERPEELEDWEKDFLPTCEDYVRTIFLVEYDWAMNGGCDSGVLNAYESLEDAIEKMEEYWAEENEMEYFVDFDREHKDERIREKWMSGDYEDCHTKVFIHETYLYPHKNKNNN